MTQMIEIEREQLSSMFEAFEDSAVKSVLQGAMGRIAWCGEKENRAAMLRVGDFHCLAGDTNAAGVREMLQGICETAVVVAHDETWLQLVKELFPQAVYTTRYHTIANLSHLNPEAIAKERAKEVAGFELKRFDLPLARQAWSTPWAHDFVGQFDSPEDFVARGIGYGVLENGVLVSGASSFSVYDRGLEVQITTRRDRRSMGLASAATAALLQESLDRSLIPHWDAANRTSLAIAAKFGYREGGAYQALMLDDTQE